MGAFACGKLLEKNPELREKDVLWVGWKLLWERRLKWHFVLRLKVLYEAEVLRVRSLFICCFVWLAEAYGLVGGPQYMARRLYGLAGDPQCMRRKRYIVRH